jgi:hypothetical protein
LLAEELVEKLANSLLEVPNFRRFGIRLSPGIAHHGVEQVLFKIPLLRLGELVKKLCRISLGSGGEISRISEVLRKNDDIASPSFNFSRRVDFRLLSALNFSLFGVGPLAPEFSPPTFSLLTGIISGGVLVAGGGDCSA